MAYATTTLGDYGHHHNVMNVFIQLWNVTINWEQGYHYWSSASLRIILVINWVRVF